MKNLAQMIRLQPLLIYVRSSLWFVPALFIFGAIVLSLSLVEVDRRFGDEMRLQEWSHQLFITRPEGARATLSTIAGSMATIAGVVFSITIVALSLASSQYTSRLLRNFMRDRLTQTVLGVLVGGYIYCLLVLRTISGGDDPFVPSLSVMLGVVLAIVAIGFFIYFIHHISSSIQAAEIADSITRETLAAIDRLFPSEIGEEPDGMVAADMLAGARWYPVPSKEMGYIQSVEPEALLAFARKHDTVLRMESAIGNFVASGRALVSLALHRPPDEDMVSELNNIYAIASYRTVDQDAAFGIRQLVDVALKALSPGINDTTTAVTCIEHLGVLLAKLAPRSMAAPYRLDQKKLRVIARGPTFDYLLSLSFSQITENSEGNTEITLCMLTAIEEVAKTTNNEERLCALRAQIDIIAEVARRSSKSSVARRLIENRLEEVYSALRPEHQSTVRSW